MRFFERSRIRPTNNDVSVADGPGAVNQLGLVEATSEALAAIVLDILLDFRQRGGVTRFVFDSRLVRCQDRRPAGGVQSLNRTGGWVLRCLDDYSSRLRPFR